MFWEHGHGHDLQDSLVGGRQNDRCRNAIAIGTSPVQCGHARSRSVTRYQSREAVLRPWRRQVVADAALLVEELRRDDRADRVTS
jgi:hypothetical protein